MILKVIKFGDSNGYILRTKNIDVNKENPFLQDLISSMLEMLNSTTDVVLSAPQVGHNLNLFVVKSGNFKGVFINPEIRYFGLLKQNKETSLSFPDMVIPVDRKEIIEIKHLNRDLQVRFLRYEGVLGMLIQQGYDHLKNKLIID